MYYGTKRREVDNIYRTYGIDTSDVIEVSKWYCAAQWTLCQMGNVNSMEAVGSHIISGEFRKICTILRLDAVCFQQVISVELIYSLCQFIQNYFLRGGAAKFFYRDYLSCSVADRSLFAESGRIIPAFVVSSASTFLRTTLSRRGLSFICFSSVKSAFLALKIKEC